MRVNPAQTTYFSFLKSRTHTQKASLEVKGEWCKGMLYPQASLVELILAKRCMRTHERILRYTKYGLWPRQIKVIGQMKSERNALQMWFKQPWGRNSRTLSLFKSAHVSICVYWTFPFLINNFLDSLLFVFMGIIFCKVKGPGPCQWPLV